MSKTIKNSVSYYCKKQRITLKQLAEKIGITQEGLSRSINGNPQLSTLEKIANCLNVPIANLFNEVPYQIHDRQSYNLKCLKVVRSMIDQHPYLRFGQILYTLGLNKDLFNEEPNITFNCLTKKYKELCQEQECVETQKKESTVL